MSELDELRDEIEELRSQIPAIDERALQWVREVDPLMKSVGVLKRRVDRIEAALAKAGIEI